MWFDIDPCLVKLDNEKYSRLNNDIDALDEDGVVDAREVYYKIVKHSNRIIKQIALAAICFAILFTRYRWILCKKK